MLPIVHTFDQVGVMVVSIYNEREREREWESGRERECVFVREKG
jgi:hypothetical protein